jgi:hypothetical protein
MLFYKHIGMGHEAVESVGATRGPSSPLSQEADSKQPHFGNKFDSFLQYSSDLIVPLGSTALLTLCLGQP